MKVNVCLVCLKTFDGSCAKFEEGENCDLALLPKFLKFAENYLRVSTGKLLEIGLIGGKQCFCEKCELAVINPVCQLYQELLSVQLRLAWELKQMGKLLENAESPVSDKLKLLNSRLLADQLGIHKLSDLEEFRTLLTEKCQENVKQSLPLVPVQRVTLTPSVGLEESAQPENNFDIEYTIKLEPIEHHNEYHSDNGNEDLSDPLSDADLEKPWSKQDDKRREKNLRRCGECEKVFANPKLLEIHHRYRHQLLNCQICSKSFVGGHLLGKHKRRVHFKKGNFPCPKCDKVFPARFKLSRHIGDTHGDKRFVCKFCKAAYKVKSHLKEHVASIHMPEEHTCPHCGKVFSIMKNLKLHIRKQHTQPHSK